MIGKYMQKPEQPTKRKPRQYFVAGVEVDHETFREYSFRKSWKIDGDTVSDITCSLWSLENYYTTEEHEKEYPIEAANARKVLEQIRAEVARKEDKTMNTPKTGKDFLEALKGIYTESRTAYANLCNAKEKAKQELEDCEKMEREANGPELLIAQARTARAKAEYNLANESLRVEYGKIMKEYNAKVAELREQFAAALEASYSANPDKLDGATMQLLTSGICSATELHRLAERHGNNPTMLRIIGGHAKTMRESKNISDGDRMKCVAVLQKADAVKDGSRELDLFDKAVSCTAYGLDKDPRHAARMHEGSVVGFFEQVQSTMEATPNRPAEMLGEE